MHDKWNDLFALLFAASVVLNLVTIPLLFMIASDRDHWKEALLRRLRK